MKILLALLLFLVVTTPARAERAGDYNAQKAIVGKTDPEFDATISASPLNHFVKDLFRPDRPVEGEPTSYEEVVPVGGGYYRNEGRYYDNPPEKEALPSEEKGKDYYQDKGLYYPPPEEK